MEDNQTVEENEAAFEEALRSCGYGDEDEMRTQTVRKAPDGAVKSLVKDINQLFDHLPAHHFRQIATPKDAAMQTKLLSYVRLQKLFIEPQANKRSHQSEGLEFMLQRESDAQDELTTLWEPIRGQEDIGFVALL